MMPQRAVFHHFGVELVFRRFQKTLFMEVFRYEALGAPCFSLDFVVGGLGYVRCETGNARGIAISVQRHKGEKSLGCCFDCSIWV